MYIHTATHNHNRYAFAEARLNELRERNLYRSLRLIEGPQDSRVRIDNREVLVFCSNNFLGLANHPEVREASLEALKQFGCGAGASRLISGNMTLHERLEQKLAAFKGYPAALLFNSGYAANVGILSSLMEAGDVIFSDSLNHASIIDGCRLSRAEVRVYRHRDTEHLERLLKESRGSRKRLIVTDALFSMDGDLAPLPDLVDLARHYGCLLMVDEAHALGVLGTHGRGVAEWFGVEEEIDLSMGTLGKALGSFGAFVACSAVLREYLINQARSLIFSTALPPSVLAAAEASIEIVEREPERRAHLLNLARQFQEGLLRIVSKYHHRQPGIQQHDPSTPIQRLILGEDGTAMEFCERLLKKGIYAQGIRPPTVPLGTARIRFSLMATHTREDVEQALKAVEETGEELTVGES
jgi:glycine C-acetyltransferase